MAARARQHSMESQLHRSRAEVSWEMLAVSAEMQCSFKTEPVAYVHTLMIAHLLISNLYPAYFQKGPGVADKIRQRHNGAIKKNQRSSPKRKSNC